jgi:hypothetical protein
MSKFFELTQNNSGGSFDVTDKVCHRIIIEANSSEEADSIAEDLGVYWNGVEEGMDCSCCGDRWYGSNEIDLDRINTKWNGYEYSVWLEKDQDVNERIESIKSRYPNSTWLEELRVEVMGYGGKNVKGRLMVDNIEQYGQIMSDLWGWTSPDCRIFYKDGTIKEFFSPKVESKKSSRQK